MTGIYPTRTPGNAHIINLKMEGESSDHAWAVPKDGGKTTTLIIKWLWNRRPANAHPGRIGWVGHDGWGSEQVQGGDVGLNPFELQHNAYA